MSTWRSRLSSWIVVSAGLLVGALLVVLAVTRTEVGREQLRVKLEEAFTSRLEGTIAIGRLDGTILTSIRARDLAVLTAAGDTVLSAEALSVRPSWRALFDGTLDLGEVTLLRPRVSAARDSSGLALLSALRRSRDDAEPIQLDIAPTRLHVRQGALFGAAEYPLRDLSGSVSVVWNRHRRELALDELTGTLGGSPFELTGLSLRGEDDRLAVDSASLRWLGSRLTGEGYVALATQPRRFGLHLSEMQISSELRDRAGFEIEDDSSLWQVEGRLSGTARDVVLEELTARLPGATLTMEGTVNGTGRAHTVDAALQMDVTETGSLLAPFGEQILPPGLPQSFDARLSFRGELSSEMPRSASGRGEYQLTSTEGRLEGDFALAPAKDGSLITTQTRADSIRLPERVVPAPLAEPASLLSAELTSRFELTRQGLRRVESSGTVSRIRRDAIGDSTSVRLTWSPTQFALEADLLQRSRPALAITVDGGQSRALAIGVRADDFDAERLGLTLGSSITGELTALRRGAQQWEIDLTSRPLHLSRSDTTVILPALDEHLTLRPDRISVRGETIRAELSGPWSDLLTTAGDHANGTVRAVRDLISAHDYTRRDSSFRLVRPYTARHDEQVSSHLEGSVVLASDLLRPLLGDLTVLGDTVRTAVDLRASSSEWRAELSASADTLVFGTSTLIGPTAQLALRREPDMPLLSALQGSVDLRGDILSLEERTLATPRVHLDFSERQGRLTVQAGREGDDHLQTHGRLYVGQDRTRLVVDEAEWRLGPKNRGEMNGTIDLFRNALHLPHFEVRTSEPVPASLTAHGTYTSASSDSLVIETDGFPLGPLGRALGWAKPIGGTVGGRLAVRPVDGRPVLDGAIRAPGLALDGYHFGELDARLRYDADRSALHLDAEVSPENVADPSMATMLPRPAPMDLQLDGTIHLPSVRHPRGAYDLVAEIERGDVFFFNFKPFGKLVSNARGFVEGRVRIDGALDHPVFSGPLQLHEGSIYVPKFNLAYEAHGPFHLDSAGVQLDGIRVRDDYGGRGLVRGGILFNDYRHVSFDLAADLDELVVMNVREPRNLPFYGTIFGRGRLTLAGPKTKAVLKSTDAVTTASSDIFIPIEEGDGPRDSGFIFFADSSGAFPDVQAATQRENMLAQRPDAERKFVEGLEMDLNVRAESGTTIHLVIDPLMGDVINAEGSGRVQLVRSEGAFSTYGHIEVSGGDYLFTAGQFFVRRFMLERGGSIRWTGVPSNPLLDLEAAYPTRASTAGLPAATDLPATLPVQLNLHVTDRVRTPSVELELAVDRRDRQAVSQYQGLEALLNDPERSAEYATSVLITNSFLLTTSLADQTTEISATRDQFAFNSLSQLVASQLNRYLSEVVPNLDLSLGLQRQSQDELGFTYGLALRLLDERLVIRGEGTYQSERTRETPQGLEAEFIVEVRLTPRVSVEAFYRREGDLVASELMNVTGAGLSYETRFTTWTDFLERLIPWLREEEQLADDTPATAQAAN